MLLAWLILALANLASCSRADTSKSSVRSLPEFEVISSDGTKVSSVGFAHRPLVVVFFDVESVAAWRTLTELEQTGRQLTDTHIAYLGIGSTRSVTQVPLDINSTRREYGISFPVVASTNTSLLKLFETPDCCDYLMVFDEKGYLKASGRPSQRPEAILSILGENKTVSTPRPETADLYQALTIRGQNGTVEPVPLSAEGTTIVNIFDEFCSECPTGSRLETLNGVVSAKRDKPKLLVIFSEKTFSEQDIQNFRAMLMTPYPLYRGNIDSLRSLMVKGRLLVAFDVHGRLVWQETSAMPENEIATEISALVQ